MDLFMMGLKDLSMKTPIWPISGFGDEQILLSNLTYVAANITKISFSVILDFNQIQEIGELLAEHRFLMKQGFFGISRYFIQALRGEDPSIIPSQLGITPLLFHGIHVLQIPIFGEFCIFFVNQAVICTLYQRSEMINVHLVLAATFFDVLM
jgi:hypothetical protein